MQAARILVPVQRDLRRAARFLGLRPDGRRAEAERSRGLVARHGHGAQRAGGPARGPRGIRNDGPGLLDHHAPAGLEVLGPLRPVPRLHGRLPRVQAALSLRSGPGAVGRGQGAAGVRGHRGRGPGGPGGHAAEGLAAVQSAGQERRRAALGGGVGRAHHGRRFRRRAGARRQDPRHAHPAAGIQFDVQDGGRALGGEEDAAFLRPETAQGIFVNFKNVLDSTRVRIPFGVAQIGKSFRNEITPRNFTFRSREFEQMEIEFFCHPDASRQWYQYWRDRALPVVPEPGPGGPAAAAAGPLGRGAEPLFGGHGGHRICVSVPRRWRVRRAGRRGPSRRFRPAQPHGGQARPQRRATGRPAGCRREAPPPRQRQGPDLLRRSDATARTCRT